MTAKSYQTQIVSLLVDKFDVEQVKREWSIRLKALDEFSDTTTYAPRLDIAIGPFNVTSDNAILDKAEIESKKSNTLVREIIKKVEDQSGGVFTANNNPRCLIAIELEWATSSKHILGGFTNASMMGYVGVLVAPRPTYGKIERIAHYTRKLKSVGKASSDFFSNVACFEADEFKRLLLR